tara:strand:- start:3505 stop:4074 length:570 start_codon:yes stop_codon:yes gene_type:complete
MLLQPGQGMGLLGAYNTPYTSINPQMNHYNSLLGRIGGLSFSQPSGSMGPVANYFDGNTLMSGSTGQPVYNLPGASYGTAQSYMDELGRMPISSNEIQSPYIYYRPQTDLDALQEALKKQEEDKVKEIASVMNQGQGEGKQDGPQSQKDKLAEAFGNRDGIGGYGDPDTGMSGGTNSGSVGGGNDASGW